MKLKNTTLALVSLIPLLFATTAYASECNDNAPLADPGKVENGYFNPDNHVLNESDRRKLEKLARAVSGQWSGVELEKRCVGSYKSPTENLQRYLVRADITRHETGAIRVEAEKERQSDRVLKIETLFISPETDIEYGRQHGWHTLEFIDENTVIFSEKYRVAQRALPNNMPAAPLAMSVAYNSRFLHEVKKIQLRNNKLTVDRKLFVNGFFVEQTGWILER